MVGGNEPGYFDDEPARPKPVPSGLVDGGTNHEQGGGEEVGGGVGDRRRPVR